MGATKGRVGPPGRPPHWIGSLQEKIVSHGRGRLGVMAGLLALVMATAQADTLYLKNGRTMEGRITEETESRVTLSMGPASISVNKSRIARIERSSTAEQASMQEDLRKKYFTHEEYVDPALKKEAALYRSLLNSRRQAGEAQARLKTLLAKAERLEEERIRLRNQRVVLADQVAEASPEDGIADYNRLIEESNRIQNRLVVVFDELEAMREQQKNTRAAVSRFVRAQKEFSESIEAARSELPDPNETQAYFLDRAEALAAASQAAIRAVDLPYRKRGDHAVVDAVVNGAVRARLMVDTGASVVTLTPRIADQLRLIRVGREPIMMTLANGDSVEAEPVLLRSLKVNDAERSYVAAVVLPDNDNLETDGLLGMSFLRTFDMQLNPSEGTLRLYDYNP